MRCSRSSRTLRVDVKVVMAEHPEYFAFQVDGLLRLSSARDVLDVVLQGHWTAEPALVGAVADLVSSAERRFAWAEMLEA